MSRCFRCDGVGCAECLDLADYRISQEMSGRATRDVAEYARVTVPQHVVEFAQAARDAALVRLTKDNRGDHLRLMLAADDTERALVEAVQDEMGGVWKVVLALAELTERPA